MPEQCWFHSVVTFEAVVSCLVRVIVILATMITSKSHNMISRQKDIQVSVLKLG